MKDKTVDLLKHQKYCIVNRKEFDIFIGKKSVPWGIKLVDRKKLN
jgi:hypothetical protein